MCHGINVVQNKLLEGVMWLPMCVLSPKRECLLDKVMSLHDHGAEAACAHTVSPVIKQSMSIS